MTKQEAIAAMQAGEKVTHRYFSAEEWVRMERNLVYTEEGYRISASMFWENRQGEAWENDWSIWKAAELKTPKQ